MGPRGQVQRGRETEGGRLVADDSPARRGQLPPVRDGWMRKTTTNMHVPVARREVDGERRGGCLQRRRRRGLVGVGDSGEAVPV